MTTRTSWRVRVLALVAFLAALGVGRAPGQESTPDCGNSVALIFQEAAIPESPHQSPELYAGESSVIGLRKGEPRRFYAALVSDLDEGAGPLGWEISLGLDGDVVASGVTSEGTAVALEPDGLRAPFGFLVQEVVDPDRISPLTGKPQGEGVISGVILGYPDLGGLPVVTLEPRGTATVLAIDVVAKEDAADGEIGRITCRDGLLGSGLPVENVWAAGGEGGLSFCDCRDAVFVLGTASFIRGDANDDGDAGMADAVTILRYLFGPSAPEVPCAEPFDVDADGRVNITDPIYLLSFKFRGTAAPPAPFPDCGVSAAGGNWSLSCSVGDRRSCR